MTPATIIPIERRPASVRAAREDRRPPEIRVADVYKSFGTHRVLRGVDLLVRRGEMIAIVGASGSGKTVLLKHMIGHLHPDQGKVLVADHESRTAPLVDLASLSDEKMDRIRRHWAVVFQKNALYTGTVYENIALGLIDVKGLSESEALERSRKMLASVGLEPDRVLKLDRDELSGGMAKRVAVARALAMDPYLMFYDEPTTGLDPELGKKIQDLIFDVHVSSPNPGVERTSIIVTHDMTLLGRLEPRVVMLHDGRIVFDGTSAAFRETKCDVAQPYIEVMPVLHRGSHRQLSGSNSEFADDDTFTRKG